MASKRSSDTGSSAILINATNCKRYCIEINKEFVIGRAKSCSIVIEEIYISRRHCVIRYEEGQYVISNHNTGTGTFLNCEQLSNDTNDDNKSDVVLKHGDLISFSVDGQIMKYIYKFCLSSKMVVKKPKLDKEMFIIEKDDEQKIGNIHTQNKDLIKTLNTFRSKLRDIIIDKIIIANQTGHQLKEFQKMMNETFKLIEQSSTEVNKQIAVVKDLVSGCKDKLREQQEKESSLDLFKNQIHNLLENDCQCPICNEIILKAHTADCHHTFCEGCITRWLSKNQMCPVCRSLVHTTNYCLVMDNFITSLCDSLGGLAKSQRDNLKTERALQGSRPAPTARRGRRRALITLRETPLPHNGEVRGMQPTIPIVDLTNSISFT